MEKLFFFIPFLFCLNVTAQEKQLSNNEILLYYAPTYTKVNLFTEESSFLSNEFFNTARPSNIFEGYQIGIQYARALSKKLQIYIGYRFTERGQEAPHYFNFFGRDLENLPEGYGGGSWDVRLWTNEFLLGVERQLYTNKEKNVSFGIKPGISIDIFRNMIIRNYIIEQNTGLKRDGCCSLGESLPSGEWFNNLWENLTDNHFRIGITLATPLKISLVKDLIQLNIIPELEYLTHLIDPGFDPYKVRQGDIFSLGLQLGITINF